VLYVPGQTIISATCNGDTILVNDDTITWYNVEGPLVIEFNTNAPPPECNYNEPILLGYHPSSGELACVQSQSTYYTFDNTNYATTDKLYTNDNCTGIAPTGYYSNGVIVRYWSGANLNAAIGC
jgi:hypothetical protein